MAQMRDSFIISSILHDKMEIVKYHQHLVVVGDGKTFSYISDLRREYPSELAFVLPIIGDWHILKKSALVLFKINHRRNG